MKEARVIEDQPQLDFTDNEDDTRTNEDTESTDFEKSDGEIISDDDIHSPCSEDSDDKSQCDASPLADSVIIYRRKI